MGVQRRLGAGLLAANLARSCTCMCCGELLASQVEHSDTCALGEATKDYYAVVKAFLAGVHVVDPSVVTEPSGLTHNNVSPADILTSVAQPCVQTTFD
eukprot:855750-Amphidinium_carterae.1